jgi:hypothetical protein
MKNTQDWHKDFFTNFYYELFMKRSAQKIAEEVNIIDELIGNKNILNIMDVCCGVGDISAEISKRRNIEAWGIEYSNDYVECNQLKNIIQGDARIKQTNQKFSLVLNWFSSFSYFNKEENYQILNNCYEYSNDLFVLETANSACTLKNFIPLMSYTKELNGETYQVERISNINLLDNTLEQDWIINNNNFKKIHNTKSYLYFPKDIKDTLLKIGFSKVDMFGLKDGKISELTIDSPRLLIKAQK